MYDRRLCLIGMAVALGSLAACASSPRAELVSRHAQAAALPGKPACFWLSSVHDWIVLNNQELIVYAPLQKDAYLLQLFQPVFDLRFHQNLGFQDVERTGQICNDSYDYLIVRGYTPPRVPIIAVHQLTMPEQTSLLQSSGKNVAGGQPHH